MKKAFTLIEVNLAMLVMATGILTIVGLYAFGYRENRQSREDVAATALADVMVSQIVAVLGSTDLKWSEFSKIDNYPADGWANYFDLNTGLVKSNPSSIGEDTFKKIMSAASKAGLSATVDTSFPSAEVSKSGMQFGLVVRHDEGSPIVKIAFRATKQPGTLLAMPLYFCEVRFQGNPNE